MVNIKGEEKNIMGFKIQQNVVMSLAGKTQQQNFNIVESKKAANTVDPANVQPLFNYQKKLLKTIEDKYIYIFRWVRKKRGFST